MAGEWYGFGWKVGTPPLQSFIMFYPKDDTGPPRWPGTSWLQTRRKSQRAVVKWLWLGNVWGGDGWTSFPHHFLHEDCCFGGRPRHTTCVDTSSSESAGKKAAVSQECGTYHETGRSSIQLDPIGRIFHAGNSPNDVPFASLCIFFVPSWIDWATFLIPWKGSTLWVLLGVLSISLHLGPWKSEVALDQLRRDPIPTSQSQMHLGIYCPIAVLLNID